MKPCLPKAAWNSQGILPSLQTQTSVTLKSLHTAEQHDLVFAALPNDCAGSGARLAIAACKNSQISRTLKHCPSSNSLKHSQSTDTSKCAQMYRGKSVAGRHTETA